MRKLRRRAPAPVNPVSHDDWPRIHAAWVDAIDDAADLRSDRSRITEYTADVVETIVVRPGSLPGSLVRFGRRLGGEGWPLEQVSTWIDLLTDLLDDRLPSAAGRSLREFAAGVALAHGWTEGNLHGVRADICFDPVTGLCTPVVLRIRLQQVFEQCTSSGVVPNCFHRMIVIDADITDIGQLEADAVMVVLADLVQREFSAGETLARQGGRIFVLVDADDGLEDRLFALLDQARARSLLLAARVLGWVEDLPMASEQIDCYLTDLSA